MTYRIHNFGDYFGVYSVRGHKETWWASFCSQSDAEAWVASKRECVPLPEPVKHRCRTIHTTSIVSRCPLGGMNVYEAEFHAAAVVMVESIASHIEGLTKEPILQEELTQALADRTGCRVVTKGTHGRFFTECTADWKA